ncbi:WW domain containing protein [Plasmodiophora brassicae]
MALPAGWDAKFDTKLQRWYFVDHNTRTTTWDDPRPLPQGWEARVDPRTKRKYFVNHIERRTAWEDPRPPPTPSAANATQQLQPQTTAVSRSVSMSPQNPMYLNPQPHLPTFNTAIPMQASGPNFPSMHTQFGQQFAPNSQIVASAPAAVAPSAPDLDMGDVSCSASSASAPATQQDGRAMYLKILRLAITDKRISPEEDKLLRELRKQEGISDDELNVMLASLGITMSDFDDLKEKGKVPIGMCCVCLENPTEFIILDCMHLCLCSDCQEMIAKSGKCPQCRAPINKVVRAYM